MVPNTPDERELELKRVCTGAGEGSDIYKILWWLGSNTLADSFFRATTDTLFLEGFATRDEAALFKQSEDAKRKFRNDTRKLASQARNHILLFYEHEKYRGTLKVEFPAAFDGEPPRKGRYGVRFVPLPKPKHSISRPSSAKLTSGESFWMRLLGPIQSLRALLVYSVERRKLGPNRYDENGLLSGSGEVAASFAISGSLGSLREHVEQRRTCDVLLPELHSASCLIVLGSSINDHTFHQLRHEMLDDDRWPAQAYLFGEVKQDGGKAGCINKVRGEDAGKCFVYYPEVLRDLEWDYALVSYFRDRLNRHTLIGLQGISTVGTRAAAEYLCSAACIADLHKHLGITNKDNIPNFELVLKITVRGYVPRKTEFEDIFIHDQS